MMCDDMCPHVKQMKVITLTIDFFILLAEGIVFSNSVRLVDSEHYCVRYGAAEEGE